MLRPWHIAVAGLIAVAAPMQAQSRWQNLGNNVKSSLGDAWDVWTSPVRGRPKDWLAAAGVVAGSAAASPLDASVDRWAVNHRDDDVFNVLDPLRPGGLAFSGKTITPIAVGALVLSVATNNQRLQEGIFGCATSYGASSVVRTLVFYQVVSRTRPDPDRNNGPAAKNGDQYDFGFPGSGEWGEHSLPGGHLANITACVMFLTTRYHLGKFVEPAMWALVGGVATARTLDRAHWLSDETLGFFFGYAVGKEVALRSSRRNATRTASVERDEPQWSPFFAPGRNGTRLGWQLVF